MKRIKSLQFLALFVFLSVSTMAQAASTTTVERIPLAGTFMACTEPVDWSGVMNFVTHMTTSNNGRVNFTIHANIRAKGVGQITGAAYTAFESGTYGERFDSTDFAPFTITWTDNINFNGRGSVPNFRGHLLQHMTINANGDMTSFRSVFTVDCSP